MTGFERGNSPSELVADAKLALGRYMGHGGGIELFRAYVGQRRAVRQAKEQRKSEIIKAMEAGLSPEAFEQAASELLEMRILEELDPVIEDLLKFCKNPGQKDDQLPNIRSALRIGVRRAPSDSEKAERKWAIQQRWIDAYLAMQETGAVRSENSIADEIAKDFGVTRRTAINHWNDKKKAEPWQEKWASEIAQRAEAQAERVAAQPVKKSLPKRRKRIAFGKGVQSGSL